MLKPQLNFNKSLDHLPYMAKMFGPFSHNWNISKGAKVGKANGLSLWLDAETFDYTYHVNAGEGFKLAIMHHLDQPIMSIRELVSHLMCFFILVSNFIFTQKLELKYYDDVKLMFIGTLLQECILQIALMVV